MTAAELAGEGGVSDAMFAVPSSSMWTSEQQKLIQTGHMTPFGTSELTPPPQPEPSNDNDPSISRVSGGDPAPSTSSIPGTSGLRLCSEGFDGLFEDPTPSLPPRKVARKKGQVSPVTGDQKKTKKGKGKKRVELVGGGECEAGEGVRVGEEGGEWVPTREEVEAMEREMTEENDWENVEGGEEEEEEEEEGSTEYTTDDELGAGIVPKTLQFSMQEKN